MPIKEFNEKLYKKVFDLQRLESKILSLINKCLMNKHNYLNIRQQHLKNYIQKD